MTADPLAFLYATHAAVQAEAEAASPGPWHLNEECDEVLAVDDIAVANGFALSGPQLRATTAHMARHDPAAVLRRIAADRKLIAAHPITSEVRDIRMTSFGCRTCHRWDDQIDGRGYCDSIIALAEGWGWIEETT